MTGGPDKPKRGRPRKRDLSVGVILQAYEQAFLNRRRAGERGLPTLADTAALLDDVSPSTLYRTIRDRGGTWRNLRLGYISDRLADNGRKARASLHEDPDAFEYEEEASRADPSLLQLPSAFRRRKAPRR